MIGMGRRAATLAWTSLVILGACSGGDGGGGGGRPTTFVVSGTVEGAIQAGVTIALGGASTATTTTDAGGGWSFGGLASGTYTVTPSRAGYAFTPSSRTVTVSDADVSGQGFAAATVGPTTYGISGTVAGATEVTITLSGAGSGTTTSDGSGAFSFADLAYGGPYTITPSKPGYAFTPSSRTVYLLGVSAVDQSFSATWVGFAISGHVTGASSVTVSLSGDAAASTTTDVAGNYTFTGLASGSYVVTPSKTDYRFTPQSRSVTLADVSATAQDFTATWITYSLSGAVSGAPASGVTIATSGRATRNTTTDAAGSWTISGLPNGSYTVTPLRAGYTFEPPTRSVTIADADVGDLTFAATWVGFTLSGTVSGAPSVTVSLTGSGSAVATTDASGNYAFPGLSNGTYTVTPSKPGYTFTPASRVVSVYDGNPSPQGFAATPVLSGISGTVGGATQSGVTIALSGAATGTVTTDGNGAYAFTGLANGSYTLTPSKPGYAFEPTSRTVTLGGTAVLDQSFTATWIGLTISGKVEGATSVTVALTGAATASTTTDASGNYAFTGLENGTYKVTPTKAGATFWPSSVTVTLSGADAPWRNFTALYGLSGKVSGAVQEGVTISLEQGIYNAGSTTTDASGNYTFASLVNATYVVTPSKPGYVFAPATITVTVNGADVSGQDFVSARTFRISGIIDGLVEKPVTVVATGPVNTTAESGDGFGASYTLTDLPEGTYTIAAWRNGRYAFLPVSRSVTLAGADVTGQDFKAVDAEWPLWPITGVLLPNNGYAVNAPANGIVTDQKTGLQWQRDVDATCYTLQEAQLHCRALGLGGLAGWRLPTLIELESIVAYGASPAVNTTVFPTNATGYFWASTPDAAYLSDKGWTVSFVGGSTSVLSPSGTYLVRCVRNPLPYEPPDPPGRFTVGVGTVTDNVTGLVWQRTLDTTTQPTDATSSWTNAQTHCASKYGHAWRLPTVKELQSLLKVRNANRDPYPAIDASAFPDTPLELFWTSTASPADSTQAYVVHFGTAGTGPWWKDAYPLYPWIRCVQ